MINNKNNKGIISLITVMSLGLFALGTGLTIASNVFADVSHNKNFTAGGQAFYSAEAYDREGIYQYTLDQDYTGETLNDDFNDTVSSDITVAPSTWGWPYVDVTGHSQSQKNERGVVRTLNTFPETLAFESAIYAENELQLGGNVTVNGNVFANDDINFVGNSATVDGDVYSAGDVDANPNSVTGNVFTDTYTIPPPDINFSAEGPDYSPYYYEAIADGTYFTVIQNAKDYLETPASEVVVYIDNPNTAKLHNVGVSFTGTLVSSGNLELTGGTYNAFENHAALLVEGNLKLIGNVVINGVVYVKGETTFGGGTPTINGTLISVNGVNTTEITGTVTINYDADYIPDDLQSLLGFETGESGGDPVTVSWGEN